MKELKTFFEDADRIELSRKEVITREGQVEKYLYWVEKGIQRSYYIKDGKEHTMAFTYPPSVTGIPESMLSGRPSRYFLECITPTVLLRVPYVRVRERADADPSFQKQLLQMTEEVLTGVLERQFELLAYTSEEKFTVFLKRSPHLLNKVPHKHLASYLGMDPSTFSKLLARVKV
ncbi:MAG: Crp/Fnr family transcriptional regulator [Owenweeksia sp.]